MVVSGGGALCNFVVGRLTLPGDCRFCKQSNRRFIDFALNEERERDYCVHVQHRQILQISDLD